MPDLKLLAKDLTKDFPRSPRATLGGYVLAARCVDKGRAALAGTAGEYHFNCPLDQKFLDFSGIDAGKLRDLLASGADDAAVGEWIADNGKRREKPEVVQWNNKMRDLRLSDLPVDTQVYMEDYIAENVPAGRVVYHWFDVYDLEEKRL